MSQRSLWQRLALATILATGFLPLWLFVSSMVLGAWAGPLGELGQNEILYFREDGTPEVHLEYTPHNRDFEHLVRDLDGNPIHQSTVRATHPGAPLPSGPPPSNDPVGWNERIRAFNDGRTPATYWYLISKGLGEGAGYFVGFDCKTYKRVGYMGIKGFRADAPPPDEEIPFHSNRLVTGSPMITGLGRSYAFPDSRGTARNAGVDPEVDIHLLSRDGKIYQFNLANRTVRIVFENKSLAWVSEFSKLPLPSPLAPPWYYGRTENAILVLDENLHQAAHYPLPKTLHDKAVMVAQGKGDELVLYARGPHSDIQTHNGGELYWLNAQGQFRKRPVSLRQEGMLRSWQRAGGLLAPSPLALFSYVASQRAGLLMNKNQPITISQFLHNLVTDFAGALLTSCLVALVFAVLCYRREVRYGGSGRERIAWTVFVLLLGLPGWIGYRFGRAWPVLAHCNECGAIVPRDRDYCLRCEREFAAPALKGTEVFA